MSREWPHHTEVPFTKADRELGGQLAMVLGDLLEPVGYVPTDLRRLSPVEQWTHVARGLRLAGLAVAPQVHQDDTSMEPTEPPRDGPDDAA